MEFEVVLTTHNHDIIDEVVKAIESAYGADSIKNRYFRRNEYRIQVSSISNSNVARMKLQLILLLSYLKNTSCIRESIASVYEMKCYENLYGKIKIPYGEIEVTNYIDHYGLPLRFKEFINYLFKTEVDISATIVKNGYNYSPDIGHKYPCDNNSKLKSTAKNNSIYNLKYRFTNEGECKDIYDMALMLIYSISRVLDGANLISYMAYDIAYEALNWSNEKCFQIDTTCNHYTLHIICDIDLDNPIRMIDGKVVEEG